MFPLDLLEQELNLLKRIANAVETPANNNHFELFTTKEASKLTKIPESWFRDKVRLNQIPYRRIGKYVRFTHQDLKEIANGRPLKRA